MAYLSNFYRGTTIQFTIPVGTLYPNTTLEAWDKVTVKLAATKGGSTVLNKDTLIDENAGTCAVELTVDNTDIAEGTYFYEIAFLHSDTSEISTYEEEYVVEAGKIKCLERV